MNDQRRKVITEQIKSIETALSTLSEVLQEEQSAYDALPEGLQTAPQGEMMQQAIEQLESANSSIEDALGNLGDVE